MSYNASESTTEYPATRVRLATNARLESFAAAFERAVPALAGEDTLARLSTDGDWSGFLRHLRSESSSGFVRLWSWRPGDVMRYAGSRTPSILWLIAHHGIAARLFRHDPGTMLYSPIRIEAHGSPEAGTVLSFEVPSARLRGFGVNKVTQAGAELDRALGDLLEDLGVPRPTVLRR